MEKLEKFSRIFKITLLRWLFEKYSKKCDFGKNCKGISLEKMKIFFLVRFSCKIEGDFEFFYKRFPCKKNYVEEIFKEISLENWSWGKNFIGDFFYNWDRNRVLSDPRYRPPTPVLVKVKVKWSEVKKWSDPLLVL